MVLDGDGGFLEARTLGNRDFEVDFTRIADVELPHVSVSIPSMRTMLSALEWVSNPECSL